MRILVMGTGGVGGYYGALLAHVGNDVTFVARGPHLAAIRERGLELRTQGKTIRIHPASAVGRPEEAGGGIELALFTVKTYDTETGADALKPAVGAGTAVLTLQNGIDSVDVLGRVLGMEHVLAGVTYIASAVVEPGVVAENGFSRQIIFGEPTGGEITPRVEAVERTLRDAGIDVKTTTNPVQTIWDKFVMVAPHATISATCQTPVGVTRQTAEAVELYRRMVAEAAAVGRASGLSFSPDTPDRIVATIKGMPEGQMSSMQRDYAAQRRVELEALTGTVVRRARQLGIDVPCFEALYAVLKVRARTFGGLPQT